MFRFISIISIISFLYGGLIQPADNDTLFHTYVQFEWEQIPTADHYELMISTHSDFTDIINQIIDSTLIYIDRENIEWDTQYYWRIRKHNSNGDLGAWSSNFSFVTAPKKSTVNTVYSNGSVLQDGLTIFSSFFNYYSAVINRDGREIWNSEDRNLVFYNTNKEGDYFGCYLDNTLENNLPGVEFNIENQFLWEEPNDEFLHHDLIQLPNGNYMGIVSVTQTGPIPIGNWTPLFQGLGYLADGVTPEFTWVGDKMVEWDKDTHEVVWSWSTFDHYQMADFDFQGGTWNQAYTDQHYDWTHVNAIAFSEETSSLYISARHLSRITRIDYPSGNIIWNMGHEYSSGDIDMGQNIGFSFQHSLQVLDNGNIVTFDNGNLSQIFLGTNEPTSRAIEMNISQTGGVFNASLVWEYELPSTLFGFASGNTEKLDNGNYLITTVGGGGTTLEVSEIGHVLWEANLNLTLPSGAVYRAMRIPGIYPVAYSVMVNDLHLYENQPSVYLNNQSLSFELYNEGYNVVTFTYSVTDGEDWFDSTGHEITLEPGTSATMTFTSANITDLPGGNLITLTVIPKDYSYLTKTVSVNGYTFPVSTGVEPVPHQFQLSHPYPNPFNPWITIPYSINQYHSIKLQIFDVTGRLVTTLLDQNNIPGDYTLRWNSNRQPSGIYYVKLTSGEETQVQKIVLLK